MKFRWNGEAFQQERSAAVILAANHAQRLSSLEISTYNVLKREGGEEVIMDQANPVKFDLILSEMGGLTFRMLS